MSELREKLAALEHEQWAHWMRYFTDRMLMWESGGADMRADYHRWICQVTVPYADLTEAEKDSDREWADKAIEIMDDGLDVYRLRVSTQAARIAELEAEIETLTAMCARFRDDTELEKRLRGDALARIAELEGLLRRVVDYCGDNHGPLNQGLIERGTTMTPREMDAKIAEWMDYSAERANGYIDVTLPFSTDLNAMSKAEDVVGERGLILEYAEELFEIIAIEQNCTMEPIWLAATATADQRARALCRVIDQETT